MTTDENRLAAMRREQRELGSVGNALRLLELLAGLPDAGVSELARSLGLSKSSIDRLLNTLTSAGFVEQDPASRRYRLSVKIVVLAESVRSRLGIVEVARPHLKALAERLHEGVNLGTFLDGALVYVETIPSAHIFRIEPRPGTRLPAYCTAAGKAILAFLPGERVDAYLADLVPIRHTPSTLTSVEEIRAALAEIRRHGYAVDHGELLEEAWCVAAPILDRDGDAVAAVSVTAPKSHYDVKRDDLVEQVQATARQISAGVAVSGVGGSGGDRQAAASLR